MRVTYALLLLAGIGLASADTWPDPTTAAWPNIPAALQNPAPNDAHFTPNMTWASIQDLPKIWGKNWASPPQYDAKQIALDQLDYPPLKPKYLAQSKARVQGILAGKYEFQQASCKPNGMSRDIWYTGAPVFLFQPGNRLIISQADVREIWMDGRPHPARVDANSNAVKYLGHSIGWWEGDTLVIDTVGINPNHEIFYGVPNMGEHIVERWSLVDPDHLKVVLTVDAPKVLEKPWVFIKIYNHGAGGPVLPPGLRGQVPAGAGGPGGPVRAPRPEGTSISAFDCDRGDSRQKVDANGNLQIDLTPPPPGVH